MRKELRYFLQQKESELDMMVGKQVTDFEISPQFMSCLTLSKSPMTSLCFNVLYE